MINETVGHRGVPAQFFLKAMPHPERGEGGNFLYGDINLPDGTNIGRILNLWED